MGTPPPAEKPARGLPQTLRDEEVVRRVCAGETVLFVPTPVGGHPGELDLNLRLGIEAGTIEPNENSDSFQRARGFLLYTLGVGYTFGDFGVLKDVSLHLQGTYYTSPPERTDRTLEGRPVDPTRCVAPARLDGSVCEFHPAGGEPGQDQAGRG